MIDVKLFAAYLLQNLVLEQSLNHKNIQTLKKNLRRELMKLMTGDHSDLDKNALYQYLNAHMINWRTILNQYLKYTSQYDCVKIGYPHAPSVLRGESETPRDRENDCRSEGSALPGSADGRVDGEEGKVYVHVDFVKPGCHTVIIYDPVVE
jgi:hypothetical protein